LTSKIHALVDTHGLPVRLDLTAGARSTRQPTCRRTAISAELRINPARRRGYADWIRALAAKKGVLANIPPRCNGNEPICFSPYLYRAHSLVARFFNKIKQCRRVAARYDRLAANYLAFFRLTSIRLWLRVNESTP
jgi:transposase